MTGLSVATISKFLNGGNVRQKNREAIQKAIEATNYKLNEHARALKTNKSRTIGFVAPKFEDVFAARLASEASALLREHHYSLFVYETHNSREGEEEAFDFFASKNVDAVIATVGDGDENEYRELFSRYNMPIVLFDRAFSEPICDTITINNEEAAYKAVRTLIDHGHRDIAIVRGAVGTYTSDQRFKGYRKALAEAGIKMKPEFVIEVTYNSIDLYDNIRDLFSGRHRPTALFAVNYFTTVSSLIVLNQLDIRIPEDISVFGFDNYEWMNVIKPQLWLMVQPMRSMVREGIGLLLDQIRHPGERPFRSVVLEAEMKTGQSIADLRTGFRA